MAEPGPQSRSPTPDHTSDPVIHLRRVAQQHLRDIDEDKVQEQEAEIKKLRDLERYAKHRRGDKPGTHAAPVNASLLKMRSAQDVLHRLQWDPALDMSQYRVGYLERFDGIKEMPASNWISESTEEEWIPQHRIKYFKKSAEDGEDEVVWDREKRVDKIFGGSRPELNDTMDLVSEDGGAPLAP